MKNISLLLVLFVFFSCSKKELQIADLSETAVGAYAAEELTGHLNDIFSGAVFSKSSSNTALIQFLLSEQAMEHGLDQLPTEKESFKIVLNGDKLLIISPDERGLLNATYALLEKLGYGFYISGDHVPETKKWDGFEGWEMEDKPLTGDRFVFNWHNFLSGCTGWNLDDWQMWIDQANKMRYNGIMVHAYGNNPMFSFEYLNEHKNTGYLNNTASGRDWGNQHINDVRRMVGGEIFSDAVFGAEASMATEEKKEMEASKLMQQTFQYAEERGTKVIFALDFDTWMANPRNIIEKLPKEAIFELIGGHITPNPDHPEGYRYYKQVLKSLIETYPQIDQLSVWHRRPGTRASLGSIWMSFSYEKFPDDWKAEYKEKLKENPGIEDNLMASGTYAYGKLIQAIQKARDEIKPELEISSGSWRFDYVPYADAMYPKNVPLLPLDWEVVFDTPEAHEILSKAGKNREMYPVIWAHHDDHRYIGRPYTPWNKLNDMLEEKNSRGFGIIHWTTHPLDLYFTSSARQVWESTKNETIESTVRNYVSTRFNNPSKALEEYYLNWLTDGPMFGRETSDHFVDLGKQRLGHKMDSWAVMKEKTVQRLELLKNSSGENQDTYLDYQMAMEEFYISFFENQIIFQESFMLNRNGEPDKAKSMLAKANPDEAIQKYVDATKKIGFTSGEKAIVFSMNTRWKADFINLNQQLGMEDVRFKFAPTQHDPLAQAPGRYTYFVDENKEWWRCLWKKELQEYNFIEKESGSFLEVEKNFEFELKSIHGREIPGSFTVELELMLDGKKEKVLLQNEVSHTSTDYESLVFGIKNGKLHIRNNSETRELLLSGIRILF